MIMSVDLHKPDVLPDVLLTDGCNKLIDEYLELMTREAGLLAERDRLRRISHPAIDSEFID